MTDLTNENIWELRFNTAIERFGSFDEYMEIPGYGEEPECPPTPVPTEYQNKLKKRFEACKQRYQGMEEYMEIPDMDLWLRLKNEIVPKLPKLERQVCQTFYTLKEMQDNMICTTDYPSDFDPNQTASMAMNSSNYVDDYDTDYDNYSMDSMDREERRYSRFKQEWLEKDLFE